MGRTRWQGDVRRLTLRATLLLIALTALPLGVAAETLRSEKDVVVKAIVAGTALFVPALIGVVTFVCRLVYDPEDRRFGDAFLLVYMTMTFISVLGVVLVFMFDKPMAALLGIALFGFLAYLSLWI